MGRVHTVRRRVEFRDTDAAGIAHFSTFFTALEAAEHDLLRSLGLSVKLVLTEGVYSFPRVAVNCQYRRPLVFEQPYAIDVTVTRLGRSSVTYSGLFREVDPATGDVLEPPNPVAEATITAVCVRIDRKGPMAPVELPAVFREKLLPYLSVPSASVERRADPPRRQDDSVLQDAPRSDEGSALSFLWENTPDPTEGAGG